MIITLLNFTIIIFLLLIAYHDFKTRTIPNKSVLLLTGFVFGYIGLKFGEIPTAHLIVGVSFFGASFLLWSLNLLGAGDVKLLFPIGVYLGPIDVISFLLSLSVVSLGTALILPLLKYAPNFSGISHTPKSIPFAPLIICAALFAYFS